MTCVEVQMLRDGYCVVHVCRDWCVGSMCRRECVRQECRDRYNEGQIFHGGCCGVRCVATGVLKARADAMTGVWEGRYAMTSRCAVTDV